MQHLFSIKLILQKKWNGYVNIVNTKYNNNKNKKGNEKYLPKKSESQMGRYPMSSRKNVHL